MSETIIAICPKCKSKNRILMEKPENSQAVCGKCKNNIYPEMPGYPIEAADLNFENNVVRAGVITLVDFYSNHCSPCKTMEPIINQLAYDLAGKARIVKLNTDQNPYTAKKYQIRAVPIFVVFRGLELGKLVGAQSIDNLKSLLDRYKTSN